MPQQLGCITTYQLLQRLTGVQLSLVLDLRNCKLCMEGDCGGSQRRHDITVVDDQLGNHHIVSKHLGLVSSPLPLLARINILFMSGT